MSILQSILKLLIRIWATNFKVTLQKIKHFVVYLKLIIFLKVKH